MDDFLKGYSQGMTGTTNGLPSQSVMEAMGRDAARNQWNNTNNQIPGGTSQSTYNPKNGTSITTFMYKAGKEIEGKKIVRDLGIGLALVLCSIVFHMILPQFLEWITVITSWIGTLLLIWAFIRSVLYLIGKIGRNFEKEPAITDSASQSPNAESEHKA